MPGTSWYPKANHHLIFFLVVSTGRFQIIFFHAEVWSFTKHPFENMGCLGYQVAIFEATYTSMILGKFIR